MYNVMYSISKFWSSRTYILVPSLPYATWGVSISLWHTVTYHKKTKCRVYRQKNRIFQHVKLGLGSAWISASYWCQSWSGSGSAFTWKFGSWNKSATNDGDPQHSYRYLVKMYIGPWQNFCKFSNYLYVLRQGWVIEYGCSSFSTRVYCCK